MTIDISKIKAALDARHDEWKRCGWPDVTCSICGKLDPGWNDGTERVAPVYELKRGKRIVVNWAHRSCAEYKAKKDRKNAIVRRNKKKSNKRATKLSILRASKKHTNRPSPRRGKPLPTNRRRDDKRGRGRPTSDNRRKTRHKKVS